jgi:hypothetical protein
MSGHLRAPSEKEPLVSIKEDTGWVPEQIWKFWRRKFLACLGTRPTVARPASFFFKLKSYTFDFVLHMFFMDK